QIRCGVLRNSAHHKSLKPLAGSKWPALFPVHMNVHTGLDVPLIHGVGAFPMRTLHSSANSGRAYDSRNPQLEQRKVPTGTAVMGRSLIPYQNDLWGMPSNQFGTRPPRPAHWVRSRMSPPHHFAVTLRTHACSGFIHLFFIGHVESQGSKYQLRA